jgi:hypothetical protein
MTEYIHRDNAGSEYLRSIRDGSFKLGLGIDCDLDQHLRYKKTDFNVFAGHANVGKTLGILYYFICLAIKHDLKFIVFSSENEIGGLKDDLISLHSGKRISDMDDMEFEGVHYFVNEHFKFVDADRFFHEKGKLMNFRDIINECEGMRFDALVIDPYNSLGRVDAIKGNTHEYDYQVMSELRMWCKKQEKSLYLLAHGNTDALRKVFIKGHDFEGYPMPLVSADIEGGGKFVNRCDNFIVLHRMTQHPSEWMKTEWHVTKIKSTKTGGKPTFKKNPVIFEAQKNMLSFKVYIRQDNFEVIPDNWVDPLDRTSRIIEPEFSQIQPTEDFLAPDPNQSKMF